LNPPPNGYKEQKKKEKNKFFFHIFFKKVASKKRPKGFLKKAKKLQTWFRPLAALGARPRPLKRATPVKKKVVRQRLNLGLWPHIFKNSPASFLKKKSHFLKFTISRQAAVYKFKKIKKMFLNIPFKSFLKSVIQ